MCPVLCLLACAGASGSTQDAQLRGFVCKQAQNPANRVVSVTAVMKPVTGTRTMELRFELLERAAGTHVMTEVSGGDLDTWLSPRDRTLGRQPGDVWVLKHPVKDLAGPARYRFRVSFRWKGKHGRVLGKVARESSGCSE